MYRIVISTISGDFLGSYITFQTGGSTDLSQLMIVGFTNLLNILIYCSTN